MSSKRKANEIEKDGNISTSQKTPLILHARQKLVLRPWSRDVQCNLISYTTKHEGGNGYYSFKGLKRNSPQEWEITFQKAGSAELVLTFGTQFKLHQIFISILGYKSGSTIKQIVLHVYKHQIVRVPSRSAGEEQALDIEYPTFSEDPSTSDHEDSDCLPIHELPEKTDVIAELESTMLTPSTTVNIPSFFRNDADILFHITKRHSKFHQIFEDQAIQNWFWFSLRRGCRKLFLFLNFAQTNMLYQPNLYGELPLHIALRGERPHKLSMMIIQMMDHGWLQSDAAGMVPLYIASKMRGFQDELYQELHKRCLPSYDGSLDKINPEYSSWGIEQYIQTEAHKVSDTGWPDPKFARKEVFSDALYRAVECELVGEIPGLVARGAKMNGWSSGYYLQDYPLHIAAETGNAKLIDVMCALGARVDVRNVHLRQPIHSAIAGGHTEAALKLIEFGAQIDVADKNGKQPIHLACMTGNLELVQKLIEKGANVEVVDEFGTSPLEIAQEQENNTMVKMILEAKDRETFQYLNLD